MRSYLVSLMVLATLLGAARAAHADELPVAVDFTQRPAPSPDVLHAQAARVTGIALFVSGLVLTLVSQPLLAMGIVEGGVNFDPHDGGASGGPLANGLMYGGIAGTVVGSAVMSTGLALWGSARHRLKEAQTLGALSLNASSSGAGASLTVRF